MMFLNGICHTETNTTFASRNITIKITSGRARKLQKPTFMKRHAGYYSVLSGMPVIFVTDCWRSMEASKIFSSCSVPRKVENKLTSCVNSLSFITCCSYHFFMLS